MELIFIGATVDVTGSMTLLKNSQGQILIDSGLYQGTDEVVKRNKTPLPFKIEEIDAIIITHAHLDHSGFIPRLVNLGFRGAIYCTKPTMKLARIIMEDSASIFDKNKHSLMHGFYLPKDVLVATSLFKTKNYHEPFDVLGMSIEFFPAGHILGAASVLIKAEKTIVFSGDLGRSNDPLIESPEFCPQADIIVMESTYGGRIRKGNLEDELKDFLQKVKKESNVGIIASFAVARAQMLITMIHKYYTEHPEDKVRLVIDSPMMVKANHVYKEFAETTKLPNELKRALLEVEVIEHVRQWESISKKDGPLIIITSSGMVSGGRILRYLENWQNDVNACLFLPGYQGEGTNGRLLHTGERTITNDEGEQIHWHGDIITSEAFSSHADQSELTHWLKNVDPLTQIILNHGELDSKQDFQKKLMSIGFKNVELAKPKTIEYKLT